MLELKIDTRQFGQPEGIEENILYSLSLGLPEFTPLSVRHDGTVCIVGSGPSLKGQVKRLLRERERGRPIVSINGAHDFLIESGLVPDFFLTVDPRGMPQNLKHANDETVYLLASRVNKSDFDLLKGKQVILWHSWSDEDHMHLLKGKTCIGGGSTSGLRAINFFYVQGFRKFHLYGLDSCLGRRGEKRINEQKLPKYVSQTDVIVGGKRYLCNMAMAAQANEFQNIYEVMPDLTVKSFGNGLISAIIAQRKRQGLHA